jgi:CRP-like cAMP-binding protein
LPDIDTIQQEIRTRLAEVQGMLEPLEREAERLTEMVAIFAEERRQARQPRGARSTSRGAGPGKAPPRDSQSAPAARRRGRPPGSGNRARQALASIGERPGITAAELAEAMGIAPNYLYRVLPRLQKDGRITKRGKGYHPAPGSEGTAPAP